jgi:putative RNA 2'-phosphotransferase
MNEEQRKRISKFASKVLRHQPELIGAALDKDGYLPVDVLLAGMARNGMRVSRSDLDDVVALNDKKRFSLSPDGAKIRAAQGHSVQISGSTVTPAAPPPLLYHGTAERSVESILREGLRPGSRIHVHLSIDAETAVTVGRRHGRPVVLRIDAQRAHENGVAFYLAENGVWLCDALPLEYLAIGTSESE